jgi:hypothetical protein
MQEPESTTGRKYKSVEDYVEIANDLIKKYGGIPGSRWLIDNGLNAFYTCMRHHPEPFKDMPRVKGEPIPLDDPSLRRTPKHRPDLLLVSEILDFAQCSMPDGWRLDLSFDNGGCGVSVIAPNGFRRVVPVAEGRGLIDSIEIHVNRARKENGLEPVKWETAK